MVSKIIRDIQKNESYLEFVNYILGLNDFEDNSEISEIIGEINLNNSERIKFESNVYYPTVFQIEDNCPTCGYRTPESRRKYSETYIKKVLERKLGDINSYPIDGVNCINKDITGINELVIILGLLGGYDLDVNVAVSNIDHLSYLENYMIKSVIYKTPLQQLLLNKNNDEVNENICNETLEFIRENTKYGIVYEFLINYGESKIDLVNKINEIKKYDVDCIEIKGFDPFLDSPEEYNPQYSKEYLLKIISILRIIFPEKELKITYASNNNNYIQEYLKYGINSISGIYTPQLNKRLMNVNIIKRLQK